MSVWREVQETLYQRFRNAWVVDPLAAEPEVLTPYTFANEDGFDVPDGRWARVTVQRIPGGPGTLGNVGNRKMDRRGLLTVQLFEPPGGGVGPLSDLAERAAKIFENCRIEPHDIRFAAVEPGEASDQSSGGAGRWWGLPVEGGFDYQDIV